MHLGGVTQTRRLRAVTFEVQPASIHFESVIWLPTSRAIELPIDRILPAPIGSPVRYVRRPDRNRPGLKDYRPLIDGTPLDRGIDLNCQSLFSQKSTRPASLVRHTFKPVATSAMLFQHHRERRRWPVEPSTVRPPWCDDDHYGRARKRLGKADAFLSVLRKPVPIATEREKHAYWTAH
jgi:hypothetical protein